MREPSFEAIHDLVRPEHRKELATVPSAALLDLDIHDLDLPANAAQQLRDLGVRRLRDLKPLDLHTVKLSPALIDELLCLLYYPKHDPGPPCHWARLFERAPLAAYTGYPGNPFHTRFGPVFYRGRLDGTAKVLAVGQDPATDEILAGRAFVGDAGQHAQDFLRKIGITSSYLMVNTVLYGIQSSNLTDAVVTDPALATYRNQLLDRAKATSPGLSLVIAFGAHAQTAVANWPGRATLHVVNVYHPSAQSGLATNWNQHLADAAAHVTSEATQDLSPYSTSAPLPTTDVPRTDLPFGIPPFLGTGGTTHSMRVTGNYETQILLTAP
ncbi:MAG: hypothetical protein QOG34_1814 [Frankiaceae bacterium]|jgi:uracil-DNA glycosylase|nr:hypothetical protein [Frankiaceae bacterium]